MSESGKIRRTLIILTLIGFLGGILIEVIIGMCVSSQEDWFFDRPSMIWQLIGSGLYGAVAMGGSIVYHFERWGLLRVTLVHYTLTLAAFLITNAVLNWFPASVLAIVLILFTVVYFIIWLVQYLRWKKTIQEMNQDLERLADQKKNEEEHL